MPARSVPLKGSKTGSQPAWEEEWAFLPAHGSVLVVGGKTGAPGVKTPRAAFYVKVVQVPGFAGVWWGLVLVVSRDVVGSVSVLLLVTALSCLVMVGVVRRSSVPPVSGRSIVQSSVLHRKADLWATEQAAETGLCGRGDGVRKEGEGWENSCC